MQSLSPERALDRSGMALPIDPERNPPETNLGKASPGDELF